MKVKRILLSLLLLVLVLGGYYTYSFLSFASGIQEPKLVEHKQFEPEQPKKKQEIAVWGGTERVNVLVMGIDSRNPETEYARSDGMLLVSVDPVSKTYDLFSILRDTYVKIPGHGSARINAALAYGGPELAMETVSQFTGLPVDYYVITDFEGFKSLIDAIGGIEFEVEKDMYYHDPADQGRYDIHLKKGLQVLDGDKALQYVRFRHDRMSDYTRTERQRKFLTAVADKMKSGTTLLQLPKILESVQPYIQTNLTSADMLKLAALGLSLNSTQSEGHQLPQMGAFREENIGGDVLVPSLAQVQQYVQQALNKQISGIDEDSTPVK